MRDISSIRPSSIRPSSIRPGSIRPTGPAGAATGYPVRPASWRRPAGIAVGVAGLALYNWWVVVALHTHLLTSPDELFSDLEAVGSPDATLLQDLDLAAGLLLLVALLLRGRRGPDGPRAEWPWLVAFAAAGAVGGHFSYVCPEGISATCRSAEWRLALPPHHYVHVLAGIVEFATATVAVYLAWQRTRAAARPTTAAVRWTGRVLVAAYPLLGYAYLDDRLGAFVEPVFFLCFTAMIAVELAEPDRVGPRTIDIFGTARSTLRLSAPPASGRRPVRRPYPEGRTVLRAVTTHVHRPDGHRVHHE